MIFYKKKTVIRKILNSFLNCFEGFETSCFCKSFFNIFSGLAVFFVLLIGLLYVSYLFLLPNFIDENKLENFISEYLSKNTKFSLDIDNLKLKPGYKFDINVKADYIKLKYPNSNDFAILEQPVADINLVNLLFGYADLSKVKTKKIILNVKFLKSKKYSVFDCFDPVIFKNKADIELRNVKITSDEFVFNLFDENINQKFVTKINKFMFYDVKTIASKDKLYKLSGVGKVTTDKFKISDLNVNVALKTDSSCMYNFVNLLSKMNYNPFQYAFEYKFYSKIDMDVAYSNLAEKQDIKGEVKLSDYTFKVKNIDLPKNNARIKFKNNKISADCDFNFVKNQFIKIKANADISKNKYVEANLSSTKIDLADLKDVIDVLVKVFNVKFNSNDIMLTGLLSADVYLRSNFKTLVSKGNLKIKDAKIYHKKLNLTLDNINSDVNFNDNKINIINSYAFVNGSKFYLTGSIDEKTNLNLKANSDLINISKVITLIQGIPIVSKILPELNDYVFKSGMIKVNTIVEGNLKNPVIKTNSVAKDFGVYIKSLKANYYSPEVLISANPDKETIKEIFFKLKNSDLKVDKYELKIPNVDLIVKNNDVILSKTPITFEGIKFDIEGVIKNYKSNLKEGIFDLKGTIPTNNNFISIKANNSNKIDFNSKIGLKNDIVKLLNFNLISNNKSILSATGEIKNPNKPEINNLKLIIPNRISIYSKFFDNLSFDIKGNALITGKPENPVINSDLNIYNFSYRPLKLYLGNVIVNSNNSVFYINSTSAKINDLAFDFVANAYYKNKKAIVDFVQINSNYIDLSKLQYGFKTLDLSLFEIKNLKGNIQTLEFADILLNNINFEGSYKDFIVTVKDFSSSAYDGSIQGSGVLNLKSNKIVSDLVLKDIALRKLLSDVNEIKKLSVAASGHLSALIKGEVSLSNKNNFSEEDLIRNANAYVKFNIDNGGLAQFAKLERFLQAGNILSQSILKLSLNSLISVVTKQNTGDFKIIEGTIKIYDAKADIQYIKTMGSNMSLYMFGKINLLSQYAELSVLGRIPSAIVNVMGNFGKFTTQKLVDKMSEDSKEIVTSITASPIEKMLSTTLSDEEISKIPSLTIPTSITREFKVNIFGPINDTKSITNFKWIIKE